MPLHRHDDLAAIHLPERQDRFYQQCGYWYYTTREGVSIGPFDKLTDAQDGCTDFVEFITGAGQTYVQTLREYGRHAA